MNSEDERGWIRVDRGHVAPFSRRRRAAVAVFCVLLVTLQVACRICCDCDDSASPRPYVIDKTVEDPDLRVDRAGPPDTVLTKNYVISWGSLIYFLSQYDNVTFQGVAGGPVGSERLPGGVIIVNYLGAPATWHFLTGEAMVLHPAGNPQAGVATSDVGDTILTSTSGPVDPPVDDDKWVTMKLLDVHDIRPDIVHVPFLEGGTWHPSGASTLGATYAEADEILTYLGLQLQSTATSGRVSKITNPKPGSIVPAGTVVTIDFAPDSTPIEALGDTPSSAIPVTAPGFVRGELNLYHRDDVQKSSYFGSAECFGRGPDVFYRLPSTVHGKTVSIIETTEEQLTISAWTRDVTTGNLSMIPGACCKAMPPVPLGNISTPTSLSYTGAFVRIEFQAPTDPNLEVILMVEHDRRDIAMFDLEFSWY